jgi:hypothetical protein
VFLLMVLDEFVEITADDSVANGDDEAFVVG